MTREADVVRSLVEMAETLVDDYDVVDLLTGLADRCVDLLGVLLPRRCAVCATPGEELCQDCSEGFRRLHQHVDPLLFCEPPQVEDDGLLP